MKLNEFKLNMEITSKSFKYVVKVIGKKYIWVKTENSRGLMRFPEYIYSNW